MQNNWQSQTQQWVRSIRDLEAIMNVARERDLSMENRNFARVKFPECASIRHNGQMFFANIKNVSLQGMFIDTNQNVPLHTPLKVTIYLPPNISIHLNAEVMRCEDNGIAVQIKKMDINSFILLRNAITLQCDDHELIMQEALKISSHIL